MNVWGWLELFLVEIDSLLAGYRNLLDVHRSYVVGLSGHFDWNLLVRSTWDGGPLYSESRRLGDLLALCNATAHLK